MATPGMNRPATARARSPHRPRKRSGVAMLEFAIVLPILLMLVLGIIEMGRVMMLNQVVTNANREACRQAIVPGASQTRIMEIVHQSLDASGVSGTGRVVQLLDQAGSPAQLEAIASKSPVIVETQIPYAENTWGFTSIMGSRLLVSRVTMRRE